MLPLLRALCRRVHITNYFRPASHTCITYSPCFTFSILIALLLSACSNGGGGSKKTTTPLPPNASLVVAYDFEGGTEGWTLDGLWHLSNVRASKGTGSIRYADPASGNYDTGARNVGAMISPEIVLGDFPFMSIDAFLDNECVNSDVTPNLLKLCGFDNIKVYVSTDSGATYDPVAIANLPAINSQFKTTLIDLYHYANSSIVIKIEFDTVDGSANNYEGAYIDNINIYNRSSLDTRQFQIPLETVDTPIGYTIPLHFGFTFQGVNYNELFVDPYGSIIFGSTFINSPYSTFMNDYPRIAAFWAGSLSPDDINSGPVTFSRTNNSLIIKYEKITSKLVASDTNSFQITLNKDGSINILYGDIFETTAIVGITEGSVGTDPGEIDLSTATSQMASGTIYEEFTGGGTDNFDLGNTTLTFIP